MATQHAIWRYREALQTHAKSSHEYLSFLLTMFFSFLVLSGGLFFVFFSKYYGEKKRKLTNPCMQVNGFFSLNVSYIRRRIWNKIKIIYVFHITCSFLIDKIYNLCKPPETVVNLFGAWYTSLMCQCLFVLWKLFKN